MITANTVKRLNSGPHRIKQLLNRRGKSTISRPVKNPDSDVTANCEPGQTKLPGTVNRAPNTGPVEDRATNFYIHFRNFFQKYAKLILVSLDFH